MKRTFVMHGGPFGGPLPGGVRKLMQVLLSDAPAAGTTPEIDDDTVSLAIAEGVGPMLGARVTEAKVTVPEGRGEGLVWEHQVCVASNLVRRRVVAALARLLDAHGIPVVLLKGMALIQSTLADGERSMADVDVIVPPSLWSRACSLVAAAGFLESKAPGRAYTAAHDYVRAFTTSEGFTIEIHRFACERTFLSLDYEGVDGLFARARTIGSGLFVPDDGDLFLTLAAHAAKHTFELPLRSFVDGVLMLRRRRLPIAQLMIRARTWGMEAAFSAWMRSLSVLDNSDPGSIAPLDTWGPRVGRFVWERTTHASPWQRFVRLAWLSDSTRGWAHHVASRALFRTIDAVLAVGWLPGGGSPSTRGAEDSRKRQNART